MLARFRKGSSRKTEAYIVNIFSVEIYISYRTIIAFRSNIGSYRLANTWGPTTGRHFTEMGCRELETIDNDAFRDKLDNILIATMLTSINNETFKEEAGRRAMKILEKPIGVN